MRKTSNIARNSLKSLFATAILTAGLLFTSCEKNDDNNTTNNPDPSGETSGKSWVVFNLTDAPASYDSVVVDIQEIRVHIGDENDPNDSTAGWYTLDSITPGKYDLLLLQNGLDTVLAMDSIPSGKLSQIRLILGLDNYVVVSGIKEPLKTPSAQQSGLKLNVNYDLMPNTMYEFWLDFDAYRSIVQQGNGGYLLKPVIKVFTMATTGSIEGHVDPANASEKIFGFTGNDTSFTIADTTSGYFLLAGLNPATYTVVVEADINFSDTTVTNVSVSAGVVTDLDTLSL